MRPLGGASGETSKGKPKTVPNMFQEVMEAGIASAIKKVEETAADADDEKVCLGTCLGPFLVLISWFF